MLFVTACSGAGSAVQGTDACFGGGTLEGESPSAPDTSLPDRLSEAMAEAEAALSAAPKLDFEGMTFIITSTDSKGVFGESVGATTVSKEKYMRLKYIAERLHVNIVTATDSIDNIFESMKKASNSASVYTHLLHVEGRHVGSLAYNGMIGSIEALPYVDTGKPYYDSAFCEEMKTPSGLYALYGEALRDYGQMSAVFYNEALRERLGLAELEGLVYSGEWTYDKMTELAKAAQAASTDESKLYGMLNSDSSDLFSSAYVASGVDSVELDGSLTVRDNTEILDAVSAKLRELTGSGAYFAASVEDTTAESAFASGKGLFLASKLEAIEKIYNMPDVWGVLPLPTVSGTGHALPHTKSLRVICYPSTSADLAKTGVFIESVFASSYKIIDAAYFDTYFNHYVRNEKSMDMLSRLFAAERTDFTLYYTDEFANFSKATLSAFSDACTGTEAYSEIFERNKRAANRSLGYIK